MASETMFQELMRYVRFDARDAACLKEFHGKAKAHFPRIAREFYDRIREHERAHALFTGEDQIVRLQKSLVRWLDRFCTGPYDEKYFEETAKIGRVHVRVGLPQEYMFAAMALIRVSLVRIAEQTMADRAVPTREAITRLLDLELAVMLDAYRDDFVARLQHIERLEMQELKGALARAEHVYTQAVEFANVLIIGVDSSGDVCLFNREAESVTGFARDEVLGRPFAPLLVADDMGEDQWRQVEDVLAGRRPSASLHDGALRTRAGKLRDIRWSFARAPGSANGNVAVFAIGQDATEENALAARTRQAEKLAALGTLAAGLAHEIRNPLNGAQLHLAFLDRSLRRSGADPDTMDAVRVVADEIKRLGALVTDFLAFARPHPLERRNISLPALCERAAQLLASEAERAGVRIEIDLPSADVVLFADSAKLEQVLLNLVRNAIEAMEPAGGGRLVVRIRRAPRHAVLEVEDDGPGLPSPDAPIFDAFFSTKPAGTGLGLSIVHRIVMDHGGAITVDSRPGRTVFRIVLPLESGPGGGE